MFVYHSGGIRMPHDFDGVLLSRSPRAPRYRRSGVSEFGDRQLQIGIITIVKTTMEKRHKGRIGLLYAWVDDIW